MTELLDDLELVKKYPTNFATVEQRILAFFIDLFIVAFAQAVIVLGLFSFEEESWEFWAIYGIVMIPYFAINEASFRQATPGKRVMGIRVCTLEGERINLAQAIFRQFGKMVSYPLGVITWIMINKSKRNQALHDLLVKTVVLKD